MQRAASQGYAIELGVIQNSGGLQGQVILGFSHARRGKQDFRDQVELVADDLAGLLKSTALTRQLTHIRSHLSLVHRLGQQVTSMDERAALLAEITRLVSDALGYEHIQLLLTEEESRRVELVHASGPFAETLMASGFSETVGRGIIGRVAETGRMWICQDVTRDHHFVSNAILPHTASELALPLRLGQRVIGVLDIQSDRSNAFRDDDVFLLQTIADQIAPVIEQHRLLAAERRQRRLADTLADVSRIISSRLEANHVLEAVIRELGRVVPYNGCRVTLLGEDGRMRVVAAKGYPDNAKVKHHSFLAREAPLSAPVMQLQRTLIIDDVRKEREWVWQPGTEQIVAWCSAPLVHGTECIGWLCLDWPEAGFFTAEHGRIVRAFADQAVIAIENARLFERARELSDILEYKVNDRTRLLREANDEIARKADELQALWRRVVDVQERERQRIAYDLHDSVAQSILASTYQLQGIRRRIGDNPDLDRRLIECQAMLDATLGEMKQIIYALRPNVLDELGLVAALENYVGALPSTDGLVTQLTIEGTPAPLKPEVELAVFRIVQETCQNCLRHAAARNLSLKLSYSDPNIEIVIADNGIGFVVDEARLGLGLVGIRERMHLVGGQLYIDSAPEAGTRIQFFIPRSNCSP
ncbi:histidine kinase [Devosia pacifica]|uniref:Histidine kinase n=1 Tax=Devosia pacifica TaxID=1335967 RepID=A0A918S5J3_9HYPH|nr:histidine kinase [Devosia pacifica]